MLSAQRRQRVVAAGVLQAVWRLALCRWEARRLLDLRQKEHSQKLGDEARLFVARQRLGAALAALSFHRRYVSILKAFRILAVTASLRLLADRQCRATCSLQSCARRRIAHEAQCTNAAAGRSLTTAVAAAAARRQWIASVAVWKRARLQVISAVQRMLAVAMVQAQRARLTAAALELAPYVSLFIWRKRHAACRAAAASLIPSLRRSLAWCQVKKASILR